MARCNKTPDGEHEFMDESYCYYCKVPRPVPLVTVSVDLDRLLPPVPKLKTRADIIKAHLSDSISDLLYYDRKEDDDLPKGGIEEAIKAGEITVDEMIKIWSAELIAGLDL